MSFIQICTHYEIYNQYEPYEITMLLASKGFPSILQQYGTPEEFPRAILPDNETPLVLFTNQVENFNQLNELAKTHKREKNTLILWDGIEDSCPKAGNIPVLSTEKLEAQKNLLNWQELCALAEDDTPIVKKKPFWKRIFG